MFEDFNDTPSRFHSLALKCVAALSLIAISCGGQTHSTNQSADTTESDTTESDTVAIRDLKAKNAELVEQIQRLAAQVEARDQEIKSIRDAEAKRSAKLKVVRDKIDSKLD